MYLFGNPYNWFSSNARQNSRFLLTARQALHLYTSFYFVSEGGSLAVLVKAVGHPPLPYMDKTSPCATVLSVPCGPDARKLNTLVGLPSVLPLKQMHKRTCAYVSCLSSLRLIWNFPSAFVCVCREFLSCVLLVGVVLECCHLFLLRPKFPILRL